MVAGSTAAVFCSSHDERKSCCAACAIGDRGQLTECLNLVAERPIAQHAEIQTCHDCRDKSNRSLCLSCQKFLASAATGKWPSQVLSPLLHGQVQATCGAQYAKASATAVSRGVRRLGCLTKLQQALPARHHSMCRPSIPGWMLAGA